MKCFASRFRISAPAEGRSSAAKSRWIKPRRLKLIRLAAVRVAVSRNEVLFILLGNPPQEVVALLLAGTCATRTRASVRFIHNDSSGHWLTNTSRRVSLLM